MKIRDLGLGTWNLVFISFFVFSFVFCTSLFCQEEADTITYRDSIGHLKPFQILNMAKNAARVGDIYKAAEYYELYEKLKPEKNDIAFELANLYMRARDYSKAKDQFLKVYEKDPAGYPEALYYHALMQKATGDYEGSTASFQKFKKETSKQKKDSFLKKALKIEMLGNEIAKNLIDTPVKAVITHLDTSVNKAHIEFSPIPADENTLIYGSLRSDTIVYYSAIDTTLAMPYKKFYTAKKTDTSWVFKGELEGPFNSPDANTGNGAFSPDRKRFYFTRCKKNFQNKMICSIFLSKLDDNGKWQEPEVLNAEINMPDFTSTQPAIGTDSRKNWETIYFISDRPGGKGGLDIWYTSFDEKKQIYTTPKNAGKINSAGDEMTPFYDNDIKTLYFSSTGFPGLGGLDIFKVAGELNKFSEPENIRAPINSSADDLYYAVAKNKEEGFWTSNREGGIALKNPTCCDDIYHFKLTHYLHIAVTGNIWEYLKKLRKLEKLNAQQDSLSPLSVNDAQLSDSIEATYDSLLLSDAAVSLYLVDKSGQTVFISKTTTDSMGNYFFKLEHGNFYKISAGKDGYFSKEENITTIEFTKSDTIEQDFLLEKIPMQPIVVKNIYFDFDKWDVTEASKLSLDTTLLKILKENPQIIVEISTHTDSKGTDKYNINLSQKRAESVLNYLVSKEIDKNRLVAKGYGETTPIAPNENSDGSDNPEGRAKNRRTEFRVIGTVAGYSGINYEE